MIAHHQHWLLAFTALLSRNGPDRRAQLVCDASETRTAGAGDCWTCLRTLPEVVVSIGPFRGSQAGGGAKGQATTGRRGCQTAGGRVFGPSGGLDDPHPLALPDLQRGPPPPRPPAGPHPR